MKPYKEATPLSTITRIRNILAGIGIVTKEELWKNGQFHSCRISIGNNDLGYLNIGTNGKGSSFEYSLASGYAEFMERLQNRILFTKRRYAYRGIINQLPPESLYKRTLYEKNLVLDYLYDAKEEIWNLEKILDYCGDELKKIFQIHKGNELKEFLEQNFNTKEFLMVPFYSVFTEEVKLLPIDIILFSTGTTGMAAGNTSKEAILQGLCEIFERYAQREIYFRQLTPPTIPTEYFSNTPIFEKLLQLINDSPYEIIIKDCSLGIGLPVIGLLIIDHEHHSYNFKLGAEFTPYRALERCLTELSQGSFGFKQIPLKIFDLKDSSKEFPGIENYATHNYKKILTNGLGFWPVSLFSDKPSYEFANFYRSLGSSNEEDLAYCLSLLKQTGYNLYIRDNSILGFPTYLIVIPGISQNFYKREEFYTYKNSFSDLFLITNMAHLNKEKASALVKAIEENFELMKYYQFNYTSLYLYNTDEDLLTLEIELLQSMLCYYIEDMEKSEKYLNIFLHNKNKEEYLYYFIVSDYINLKHIKKLSDSEVREILIKFYGKNWAEEVIKDLFYPDRIFQYYNFPNCFNCEKCLVKDTCKLFQLLEIEKYLNLKSNIE